MGDLETYYDLVSEFLAPYLSGRQVTMIRAPGGVGGPLVLERQRHFKAPAKGLGRLAGLRILEIYTIGHGASGGELAPDWLTLEVGMPGFRQDESELLEVASAIEEVLTEFNLVHVWKTVGYGGLHVMVPLREGYSSVAVFDFAKVVAELAHERVPGISALATKGASKTNSRIRIDYHRSGRSDPILAPFSPRAGQQARISLPMSWSELASVRAVPRPTLPLTPKVVLQAGQLFAQVAENPNDLETAFARAEGLLRSELGSDEITSVVL